MATLKQILDRDSNWLEVQYVDEERPQDLLIKTFDDMEPYIERAKALSELSQNKNEMFRHAAVIPRSVLDRSFREGWDRDDWKKWANDPTNKVFRTWPGNL